MSSEDLELMLKNRDGNLLKTQHSNNNDIVNGINYSEKLNLLFNQNYLKNLNNFKINVSKLDSLSPLKIMGRGFSLVTHNETIVKSVKEINNEDILDIKFKDGLITTKVIEIKEK